MTEEIEIVQLTYHEKVGFKIISNILECKQIPESDKNKALYSIMKMICNKQIRIGASFALNPDLLKMNKHQMLWDAFIWDATEHKTIWLDMYLIFKNGAKR